MKFSANVNHMGDRNPLNPGGDPFLLHFDTDSVECIAERVHPQRSAFKLKTGQWFEFDGQVKANEVINAFLSNE